MKFAVYYLEDPAKQVVFEFRSAEWAAREFLRLHPRTDTSQITVESLPVRFVGGRTISHFRACDLLETPVSPEDVGEEELITWIPRGPEAPLIVSGSPATLRLMATGLLRRLDDDATIPSAAKRKHVYSVSIIPGLGSPFAHYLSFEVDPEIPRRLSSQREFPPKYGRAIFQIVVFALSCIGLWNVVRWIL
jgi:hypothetical protein